MLVTIAILFFVGILIYLKKANYLWQFIKLTGLVNHPMPKGRGLQE